MIRVSSNGVDDESLIREEKTVRATFTLVRLCLRIDYEKRPNAASILNLSLVKKMFVEWMNPNKHTLFKKYSKLLNSVVYCEEQALDRSKSLSNSVY